MAWLHYYCASDLSTFLGGCVCPINTFCFRLRHSVQDVEVRCRVFVVFLPFCEPSDLSISSEMERLNLELSDRRMHIFVLGRDGDSFLIVLSGRRIAS